MVLTDRENGKYKQTEYVRQKNIWKKEMEELLDKKDWKYFVTYESYTSNARGLCIYSYINRKFELYIGKYVKYTSKARHIFISSWYTVKLVALLIYLFFRSLRLSRKQIIRKKYFLSAISTEGSLI